MPFGHISGSFWFPLKTRVRTQVLWPKVKSGKIWRWGWGWGGRGGTGGAGGVSNSWKTWFPSKLGHFWTSSVCLCIAMNFQPKSDCYFSLLAVLWPHDKKYKKLVTLEILIWDKLMLFLVLFGGQLNFFLKKGLIIISE